MVRKHCSVINGEYYKDLTIFGKDLKDIIIIDNSPEYFSLQKENGIPIQTWQGDPNDKELSKLINLLIFLSKVDDVRAYIPNAISNTKQQEKKSPEIIESKMLLTPINTKKSSESQPIIKTEYSKVSCLFNQNNLTPEKQTNYIDPNKKLYSYVKITAISPQLNAKMDASNRRIIQTQIPSVNAFNTKRFSLANHDYEKQNLQYNFQTFPPRPHYNFHKSNSFRKLDDSNFYGGIYYPSYFKTFSDSQYTNMNRIKDAYRNSLIGRYFNYPFQSQYFNNSLVNHNRIKSIGEERLRHSLSIPFVEHSTYDLGFYHNRHFYNS